MGDEEAEEGFIADREFGACVKDRHKHGFASTVVLQEKEHSIINTDSNMIKWKHIRSGRHNESGDYFMPLKAMNNDITQTGADDVVRKEVLLADVSFSVQDENAMTMDERIAELTRINAALDSVNDQLDRYTAQVDKKQYAAAVFSGILAGAIDSLFVGELKVTKADIDSSHIQVNKFIQNFADKLGLKRDRLDATIANLEDAFKVPQDNIWKGADIGVSAKNHHLADLAHHPTPLGLASAIIVQFLRVGIFVNKEGEWHFKFVETTTEDIVSIAVPVFATGVLNWLVALAEKMYQEETEEEVSPFIHKLSHLVASTPIIIEIAKCANNWFGHLVSDMGGSKNKAGKGMGIPGILLSLFYEIAALPGLKDTGLPKYINDLYEKQRFNLRHEIPIYKNLGRQAIPVVMNEVFVRMIAFITMLGDEIESNRATGKQINWKKVVPINNRTVDRMITVASMTFTVADTADAAVRAAIESGANWVLFAGNFVKRFNYVGAGRAAIAIVKEVSNERKETQILHEKLILMRDKTDIMLDVIQDYKEKLEEEISRYLAEDIQEFLAGFDLINAGLSAGDSNLVIKGNVTIQRVLGREPQFTTQDEFDVLMESDEPLIL